MVPNAYVMPMTDKPMGYQTTKVARLPVDKKEDPV
jgi:hypothetical protein